MMRHLGFVDIVAIAIGVKIGNELSQQPRVQLPAFSFSDEEVAAHRVAVEEAARRRTRRIRIYRRMGLHAFFVLPKVPREEEPQ